ncbi:MAG: WG repeat-containing protein [Bacteroidetes bacterium]|nr:WG repeat-containing protein [Bacteroidota bacterium]
MKNSKLLLLAISLFSSNTIVISQNFSKQDEKSGLYGIVDGDDNYIVKPIYKEVDFNFGYKTGLSLVKNKNDKYGFINETGKEIIPCKYDNVNTYPMCINIVQIKTGPYEYLNGIIDSMGKEIIPIKYGRMEYYPEDELLVVGETGTSELGVMNLKGEIIIPFQYAFWSKQLSKGIWPVGKNDVCGVVNMKNEIVVPFIYEMIESYSPELNVAPAKKGGKFGFIDRTGKEIVPFVYQDAWPSGNYLAVKKDGKWGLIDINNKIILPFEYASISSASKTTAWVTKNENEDVYEIDVLTKQKVGK